MPNEDSLSLRERPFIPPAKLAYGREPVKENSDPLIFGCLEANQFPLFFLDILECFERCICAKVIRF